MRSPTPSCSATRPSRQSVVAHQVQAEDKSAAYNVNDLLTLGCFATGYTAVEVRRFLFWHAQALPVCAGEMFGKKHNLAHVVSVMADLTVDSLHYGMRLGADSDRAR
jgi:hypothetical protein